MRRTSHLFAAHPHPRARHAIHPGVIMIAALAPTLGCRSDPPPALADAPELHGRRLLEETADGLRPVFDAARRPIIRLVTPSAAAEWSVWWHHGDAPERLPAAVEQRADVTFLRVTGSAPAIGTGTLALRADDHPIAEWPARWDTDPDARAPVAEIARLRAAGADAAALERAADPPDPDDRLWALVELARAHFAAGRLAAAEATWLDGAALAERRRLPTEAARRLVAAAYVAHSRRALGPMRRHLDRAEPLAVDAAARALLANLTGVLAFELGEWRRAEAAFDAAAAAAAHLGLDDTHREAIESRALLLSELGLHDEALAQVRAAARDAPQRDRPRLAHNEGWIMLRAMDAGVRALDLAAVRARLAVPLGEPAVASDVANLAVNRAWVELLAADPAAAARHLDAARAADPDGATRAAPYADLLAARVALAADDPARADALFAALDARAIAERGPDGGELGWRTDLGRARAARLRGDLAGARAHFRRGLARLDRLGARTPLRHARVPFFADRRAIVAEAIDAALAADDPAAAFALADHDRGRVLRGLRALAAVDGLRGADRQRWAALRDTLEDTRARLAERRAEGDALATASRAAWRARVEGAEAAREAAFDAAAAFIERHAAAPLPTAAPPLEPGEAILIVAARARGHVALWATPTGHHATPLEAPAETLPTPPAPFEHLYLVAPGRPDLVRLATRASVERGFTLSLLPVAALAAVAPRPDTGRPLVVADPTWELPQARRGGRALAARLDGARLLIGDAATPDALRAALPDAAPVHFSGHGVLRAERPWGAHLVLAGGARFDVFDVLGARLPGGVVVLSGCETGADRLSTRDDVLGLPEAFLVAGADAVIAADRVLPDAEARRFGELFYAHDGPRHPGPALLAAARTLRAEGHATWDAWRLVGRPHLTRSTP